MGCTCFSSDTSVKCDHQRDGDEKWTVEIDDPKDDQITIDDSVVRELMEGKGINCPRVDDARVSAAFAAGRAKSEYYNNMHRRFVEQDRLWEQLRQLHRTVKPRPHGQRQTIDLGDAVPPELRYLTY